MHYVSGHEVVEQITREVRNLALSPSIQWNKVKREEGHGEYYWCRTEELIATKVVHIFDCPAEHLLYLIRTTKKMGYGSLDITVLEEYDNYNQILVLKSTLPRLKKIAHSCIYRATHVNYANHECCLVFQTIDHEKVVDDPNCAWWNYAPSGYIITPLPGDPNKCHMIFVTQITEMGNDTEEDFIELFCTTGGLTAKAFEELRDQAKEYKIGQEQPVITYGWKEQIRDMRRSLYSSFLDLSPDRGWKCIPIRGFEIFTKFNHAGEYQAALRSSFFSPDSCREVAIRLYEAIRNAERWNTMTYRSTVLEEIGESACVVVNELGTYDKGTPSDSLALISCNFNSDGICDLSFQSIPYDKYPPVPGRQRTCFPLCGFIISPNPHGCTIQYMLQPPPAKNNEGLKIAVGRLISYIHLLRSYVTQQPTATSITVPPSTDEYTQVFGEFAKMVLSGDTSPTSEPTHDIIPPPPPPPPVVRKRKYSTSALMAVDELVRKITPGESPARPFLFLVPNSQDGHKHRLVRRKWALLSNSIFDLLPDEIFETIVGWLDVQSMLRMLMVCSHFKDLMSTKRLWAGQYRARFGRRVTGQISRRYCGDDDATAFFTDSFTQWKDLFLEKHHIEKAWMIPDGHAHRFRTEKAHSRAIRSLVHLPLCHRLVSGSGDKVIRAWNTAGGSCLSTLHGESGVVTLVAVKGREGERGGEEGCCVKAGYKSGGVRLIDASKGTVIHELKFGDAMRGCTFLPGRVATWDEEIDLWEEETQQRLFTLNEHTHHITECAVSSNSSLLYSASRDRTVKMWDLKSGVKAGEINGHTKGVNSLVLIGGTLCVTVSSDKSMKVWDVRSTLKPVLERLEHTGKIRCIRYSEVGKRICTGGVDGVRIWRSVDFSPIRWDPFEPVAGLAMDEESIAYGSTTGVLQYYDFVPHR